MPLHDDDIWELRTRKDDVLVGRLLYKDADFPWVICDFQPTVVFEAYHQLFVEDDALSDRIAISDDDALIAEYDRLYQKILDTLKLVAVGDANPIGDFLLHIYGDEAHFRA